LQASKKGKKPKEEAWKNKFIILATFKSSVQKKQITLSDWKNYGAENKIWRNSLQASEKLEKPKEQENNNKNKIQCPRKINKLQTPFHKLLNSLVT